MSDQIQSSVLEATINPIVASHTQPMAPASTHIAVEEEVKEIASQYADKERGCSGRSNLRTIPNQSSLPTNAVDTIKSYLQPTVDSASVPLSYHVRLTGGVDDTMSPIQIQTMIEDKEMADAMRISLETCPQLEETKRIPSIFPVDSTHVAKDLLTARDVAREMGMPDQDLGLDSESMGIHSKADDSYISEELYDSEGYEVTDTKTTSGKVIRQLENQISLVRSDIFYLTARLSAIGKLLKKNDNSTIDGVKLIHQVNSIVARVGSIDARVDSIAAKVCIIDEHSSHTDLCLLEIDAKLIKIMAILPGSDLSDGRGRSRKSTSIGP